MKSNKQDTLLIGHAHRMREYRKRQREQDPKAYKKSIKNSTTEISLTQSQERTATRLSAKTIT
jgi:hypothetical protein